MSHGQRSLSTSNAYSSDVPQKSDVPTPPLPKKRRLSLDLRDTGNSQAAQPDNISSKRQKGARRTAPRDIAIQPPAQVLSVFVFGTGENGELGLGPKQTVALRPRLNPFLDPNDPTAFRVTQLDCGGMHTVAITEDNSIITWGVNDNGALGRDTSWEGGLRDADASSNDDNSELADLNPYESTPAKVSTEHFPPRTTFVQVAAGDSCSFALTSAGFVYGWGTFVVCLTSLKSYPIVAPIPILT